MSNSNIKIIIESPKEEMFTRDINGSFSKPLKKFWTTQFINTIDVGTPNFIPTPIFREISPKLVRDLFEEEEMVWTQISSEEHSDEDDELISDEDYYDDEYEEDWDW